MKNYVSTGKTVTLTANRALTAGAGLLVGNIFGIANDDAANSASVEADIVGVFDLNKDASTFAQGDKVYWDNTGFQATSTVGSNKMIGCAMQAQVTGDTTVRVRLNGISF